MKKIKTFKCQEEFEEFINKSDIEVISIDIKVLEQNCSYQEGFAAIVFYKI